MGTYGARVVRALYTQTAHTYGGRGSNEFGGRSPHRHSMS